MMFGSGRADEPRSAWGLIERNAIGGVEVVRQQADSRPWRDDGVTALCLVSRSPLDDRIEYDVSWRPVDEPLYHRELVLREASVEHRETLGERATRLKG